MPRSAPRPCNQHGCKNLVYKGRYCDDCKKDNTWIKKDSIKRLTTTQKGYGHSWRNIRKVVMRRDKGMCQPCLRCGILTAFTAVDHIIPKFKGGTDNVENLQCICDACHKLKTTKEKQ